MDYRLIVRATPYAAIAWGAIVGIAWLIMKFT